MKISFKTVVLVIIGSVVLSSCGSKKGVITSKGDQNQNSTRVDQRSSTGETKVDDAKDNISITDVPSSSKPVFKDKVVAYVYQYKDVAMSEMQLYKIPASITLAQGILESGVGKGRLAVKANNHFGIKCHTAWTGERIYHDDDELQECFRKYKDPNYSYRDHSLFLTERKRYASLFQLDQGDYKGWARGLRKAGYATDKKYPQKLISLIERYDLQQYDAIVLGKEPSTAVQTANDVENHIVKAGDTLYSLSRKYNLTVAQLKSYNDLKSDVLSVGQVLVLRPQSKN